MIMNMNGKKIIRNNQDMSKIRPRYVQDMSNICLIYAICPRCAFDLPKMNR